MLEENITQMLECCAELLEKSNAFLVLNLYSMGLSSTLARTAVRQCFGAPKEEECGELYFEDKAGKQLPLGTYYRFRRYHSRADRTMPTTPDSTMSSIGFTFL